MSASSKTRFEVIKKIAVLIVIMIIFSGVVAFFFRIAAKNDLEIKNGNISTIGRTVGQRRSSYTEYFVNNIRYENGSVPSNIFEGEYYKVYFKKENPVESYVDYTQPVFLKEQVTATMYVKISSISINNIYFSNAKFIYNVGGVEYVRFQKIEDRAGFKEGETYRIRYLLSNPGISALESGPASLPVSTADTIHPL